jgi:hypothetical protein
MAARAAGETLLGPGPQSSRSAGASDGGRDVITPRLVHRGAAQQQRIPIEGKSGIYVLEFSLVMDKFI